MYLNTKKESSNQIIAQILWSNNLNDREKSLCSTFVENTTTNELNIDNQETEGVNKMNLNSDLEKLPQVHREWNGSRYSKQYKATLLHLHRQQFVN